MLSVSQNNQHFSIVSISVGGELEGIVVVLSHGHCTIESYRPLLLPPSPLAVCPLGLMLPSATEEISDCMCSPPTPGAALVLHCVAGSLLLC